MGISDIIQIISIVASTGLGIISLFIAIKSLKQSQRSIELTEETIHEANRPYVVVYVDYIQVLSSVHEYIIVKNFGNTGAVIDSITFSPEIFDDIRHDKIFSNLTNHFIAPNQSISTVSAANVMSREDLNKIIVNLKYHDKTQSYEDTFYFNDKILHDLKFTKSNPSKNKTLEEVITKSTEEILRRNL